MSLVSSSASDPCDEELQRFTACVNQYPQGLKETDCEEVKTVFRKCMKEWRESKKISNPSGLKDSFS